MRLKKVAILVIILLSGIPLSASAAGSDVEVRKDVLKDQSKAEESAKERVFVSSFFDYGTVELPSGGQTWTALMARAAYLHKGLQLPYFEFSRYSRGGNIDYTYDLGGYYKIKRCYLNVETGAGSSVDYIYKYKFVGEFSHPIYKTFYLRERYKFLLYNNENFNILALALVYYFKNHYIEAEYDADFSSKRGYGQWGSTRFNLNLSKTADLWIGGVVGERIYDVLALPSAVDAFGFIVYGGFRFSPVKNLFFSMTFSYAQEDPSFKHRSVVAGLYYKF
ncbi:MAG: YaiO family outer membrane beta-barrel protein [Pseudomonadota bacterium]